MTIKKRKTSKSDREGPRYMVALRVMHSMRTVKAQLVHNGCTVCVWWSGTLKNCSVRSSL
eukprot:1132278-Prorocentrum_lima.AAC.1